MCPVPGETLAFSDSPEDMGGCVTSFRHEVHAEGCWGAEKPSAFPNQREVMVGTAQPLSDFLA